MKVIIVNKSDFNVIQFNGVTNIAYAANQVTITHGGGTGTFSLSNYTISILW